MTLHGPASNHIHTTRSLSLSQDLPVMLDRVDVIRYTGRNSGRVR